MRVFVVTTDTNTKYTYTCCGYIQTQIHDDDDEGLVVVIWPQWWPHPNPVLPTPTTDRSSHLPLDNNHDDDLLLDNNHDDDVVDLDNNDDDDGVDLDNNDHDDDPLLDNNDDADVVDLDLALAVLSAQVQLVCSGNTIPTANLRGRQNNHQKDLSYFERVIEKQWEPKKKLLTIS